MSIYLGISCLFLWLHLVFLFHFLPSLTYIEKLAAYECIYIQTCSDGLPFSYLCIQMLFIATIRYLFPTSINKIIIYLLRSKLTSKFFKRRHTWICHFIRVLFSIFSLFLFFFFFLVDDVLHQFWHQNLFLEEMWKVKTIDIQLEQC